MACTRQFVYGSRHNLRLFSSAAHRSVQSSRSRPANPLPFSIASKPPPPASAATQTLTRKPPAPQADASAPTASKPSGALHRRFWKHVSVQETPAGLEIHLDSRPVRTPDKNPLVLPRTKPHLATAIALEWDGLPSTQHAMKSHHIPLTSLAVRALALAESDAAGDAGLRDGMAALAMRHLGTDTLLCWAPPPSRAYAVPGEPPLRDVQAREAARVTAALERSVWPGVVPRETLDAGSILPRAPLSDGDAAVVRAWVAALPAWELAALERGVLAAKSLLVAARLVVEWSPLFKGLRVEAEGERFGVEEAARVASLEVAWQIERWGEVEDTHDVEREDLKRQLGSVVLLVHEEEA